MARRIGATASQASRDPPGMMAGPCSAPSSPPDTPVPRKWIWRCGQLVESPVGVAEEGVAAVDEDVAGLEMRQQVLNDRVDRRPAGTIIRIAARPLERRHQGRRAVGARDAVPSRRPCSERLRLRRVEIVARDRKPRLSMFRARLAPITPSPTTPIAA